MCVDPMSTLLLSFMGTFGKHLKILLQIEKRIDMILKDSNTSMNGGDTIGLSDFRRMHFLRRLYERLPSELHY
jgi:hypothetical protein